MTPHAWLARYEVGGSALITTPSVVRVKVGFSIREGVMGSEGHGGYA